MNEKFQLFFQDLKHKFFQIFYNFLNSFSLKFYIPINPLIKVTVFNHFCGGISELDCIPIIKKMYQKKVSSVLDFSTEAFNSEEEFDSCYDKKLSIIEFVKNRTEIPFTVFKPTCLGSIGLFKKKTNGETLNEDENIPSIFKLGLRYDANEKVAIFTEGELESEQNAKLKIGLEYKIIEQIQLRTGFSTNPAQNTFGIGYSIKNIQLDVAIKRHQILGYSPHFSVSSNF